jgi:hypothetical protein
MNFTEFLGSIENSTPVHTQKAILWGPESLLVQSVEHFLQAGKAWEVVKLTNDCGVDYLIQQVKTVKPTIVILCQEKDASDVAVLAQLAQVETCSKVVTVSMESNLMQVYSRQHVIMRDVSDLLSVVNNKYFPNTQPSSKEEV